MAAVATSDTAAREIRELHSDIMAALQSSLEKAVRIGELLAQRKAALPHGRFIPWIEAHLPFSDRTARNYMRLFRERDRWLKSESVSDLRLGAAYKLLAGPAVNEPRKLIVVPEIRDLLPPHSTPEYETLALNIQRWGCLDAIDVWEPHGIILDGHARYAICKRHGISFETRPARYGGSPRLTRTQAEIFRIEGQLSRRNHSPG